MILGGDSGVPRRSRLAATVLALALALSGLGLVAWFRGGVDAEPTKPAGMDSRPAPGVFPWHRTPGLTRPGVDTPGDTSATVGLPGIDKPALPKIHTDHPWPGPSGFSGAGPSRAMDDPTAALAGVLPQPVRLARSARQRPAEPLAQASAAGTAALPELADPQAAAVSYRDAQGRAGLAELGQASLGEAELGLPLYPGAQALPGQSFRVQDPRAGLSVSLSLWTPDGPAQVASFYRGRLAAVGAAAWHEVPADLAPPWRFLNAGPGGAYHAVTLVEDGGGTRVVLLATRPASGVSP